MSGCACCVARCAQTPSEATDARLLRSNREPSPPLSRAGPQVGPHQFRIAIRTKLSPSLSLSLHRKIAARFSPAASRTNICSQRTTSTSTYRTRHQPPNRPSRSFTLRTSPSPLLEGQDIHRQPLHLHPSYLRTHARARARQRCIYTCRPFSASWASPLRPRTTTSQPRLKPTSLQTGPPTMRCR